MVSVENGQQREPLMGFAPVWRQKNEKVTLSLVLSHREHISSLSSLHSVPTQRFLNGSAREVLARPGEGLPYPLG